MTAYGTPRRLLALLAMLGCWIGSTQAVTNQWSAAGSMATARESATATLLPSGKVLVAGGFNDSFLAGAELYDPTTNNWSAAGALATARNGHTATLLPSGKVLVAGGNFFGALASAELYDPATNSWSAASSLSTGRLNHTATLLPSGKVLVAGGSGVAGGGGNGALASAELYDPATNSWSAAGSMATARGGHTATLLPSGEVLVVGGSNNFTVASAELYDPATNSWSSAGSPVTARRLHTTTLLPSGKVLVAGGLTGSPSASAELYDPATNSWLATGALVIARCGHTATLLPSGNVLVAAGRSDGINYHDLTSAELYDPAASSWSAAGSLADVREYHTTTPLPSGKVLVAGGYNHTIPPTSADLASAELYDPATNRWSSAGAMTSARAQHTATQLPSGKVLVVGGFDGKNIVASAELYDPTTNSWSPAGAMAKQRIDHTATLLPSGKVLVTGGFWSGPAGITGSAEVYDPATNSWSKAAPMTNARELHTATLLSTGKVLVAGGYGGQGYMNSAELYDPTTDSWSSTGTMASRRDSHTATLLPSGKVLVAGGLNNSNPYYLNGVELYDPATGSWSAAGALANERGSHTATLLPSGKVLAVGGLNESNPVAGAELYDPATSTWSAAASLSTARAYHTASLLPSGKVLVAGGGDDEGGVFASAELFDAGLSPDATRIPSLSAVNAFLLQTSALTATANASSTSAGSVLSTGFMPNLEGSGGTSSASNAPVLQIQRIDNDQMLFVPNDETINLSDTSFTGSASGFAGFPAGPVRVRAWVNGVPSAARYTTFTTPGFVSLNPARLLDTRAAHTTVDGQYQAQGALPAGGRIDLPVLGRGGVAASAVDAVVLNVTVTDPVAAGFVTVWPTGTTLPNASNLNYVAGDTVANLVVVKLGTDNQVSLFSQSGTHLIADVVGYFVAGSDLHAFSPERLLDTRSGSSTLDGRHAGGGAVAPTGVLNLPVAGRGSMPATGAGAVILNLTATAPTAASFVTAWPGDVAMPGASSLNFVAGQTVANLVIGKLSGMGSVSFYNNEGSTELIADVTAWFPANADLTPLNPARLLDTRVGSRTIDGLSQATGFLAAGTPFDLTVAGRGGVPNVGVGAVVVNITVTNPTGPGFLQTWPSGSTRPTASNVNYVQGKTVANLAIVKVGANGKISLYSQANTDAVVDVVGWFR